MIEVVLVVIVIVLIALIILQKRRVKRSLETEDRICSCLPTRKDGGPDYRHAKGVLRTIRQKLGDMKRRKKRSE